MERFRFDKGFTLVEIIVAIAVVGIVGVAFSGFFINSARIITATDEREKAIIYAQTTMEELKSDGYENINPDNYPQTIDIYKDEGYTIVIEVDKDSDSALYKILVKTKWDDNKKLEIVSYISEG